MNLALKIAKRYLFSKKSTNAINIISGVSVLGMIGGTMALLLVLSVFNGFEDLVKSLYNTFNPDIKITAKQGKVFVPDSAKLVQLRALPGVAAVSEVLEENALLQYTDRKGIYRLKGIDDEFAKVSGVDTTLYQGEFVLKRGETDYAISGIGVEHALSINIYNEFTPIKVFMPKREGKASQLKPENAFTQDRIYAGGSFAIQQDFDSKYVLVPLRFMRRLLAYGKEVSALEIALQPDADKTAVQQSIATLMGDGYWTKDRYQQDAFLYQIMKTEKWVVYLILSFILAVASFNIVGSLSMLVIEKKHDIGILKAMGATRRLVRRVFLAEGVLMSLLGAGIGMFLAFVLCLIQQYFEVIKLGGQSFLIKAYPVSMRALDFLLVFVTVVVISLLASYFPAMRAAEQDALLQKE